MAIAEHHVAHERITQAELREELDRLARERLAMSGEQFLARWRRGDLDDFSPTVSRLAVLARLITD